MPKYDITEERVSVEIWRGVEAPNKQAAYDLLNAGKLGRPDRTDGHSYSLSIDRVTKDGRYDPTDKETFVEEDDEEEEEDDDEWTEERINA